MGKIKQLPDHIINLIAAGEVVERPASVVKELLENSLDATATKIILKLEAGGIDKITIEDNGSGMEPADALLAFTQHATSKVYSEEDLQSIASLGFRGEALASISSVAEIEMLTLAEKGESSLVTASNSTIQHSTGTRTSSGTTTIVSGLFNGIPARKKFLRTATTEFKRCQEIFQALALTNLSVDFELYHNGKQIHKLPATNDFTTRVFDLWGKSIAENLYELTAEYNNRKVTIFAGKPDIGRSDRSKQYIFINGRHISDKVIQRAVTEAYKGFLHRDLHPVYFIFLELPNTEVDVNVHPRKQEVRFSDSSEIYRLVYNALRTGLDSKTQSELRQRIDQGNQTTAAYSSIPSTTVEAVRYEPSSRSYDPKPSNTGRTNIQQGLGFTRELLQSSSAQPNPKQSLHDSDKFDFDLNIEPLQVLNTYIVYQSGDSIIFVDQHAAAESIQYERILNQSNIGQSKRLLVPEVVELPETDKQVVIDNSEYFSSLGLELSDFGEGAIQISATPEALNSFDAKAFLAEFIERNLELGEEIKMDLDLDTRQNLEKHNPKLHTLIATLACHGSIRAGQKLSKPEMIQLIVDLKNNNQTYNCPHGRPVSWVMSKYDLEKNFNRIVS